MRPVLEEESVKKPTEAIGSERPMETGITLLRTNNGLQFSGLISEDDFPQLDRFDLALLRECESGGSPDWLLALECIFRRMNEQNRGGTNAQANRSD